MYGYGRGFGVGPGPGAFGFSLTSHALRDNPELPGEWERGHYNQKKAARVARKIEEIARKAEVGGRWFHYFNPDLRESLAKAFRRTAHPEAEGDMSNADLKAGAAQIRKYLVAEKDRFNARKHGVHEDEHWRGKHRTAEEMLEEWKRVEDALTHEGRSRSGSRSGSPKTRRRCPGGTGTCPKRSSSKGGRKRKTQRRR